MSERVEDGVMAGEGEAGEEEVDASSPRTAISSASPNMPPFSKNDDWEEDDYEEEDLTDYVSIPHAHLGLSQPDPYRHSGSFDARAHHPDPPPSPL